MAPPHERCADCFYLHEHIALVDGRIAGNGIGQDHDLHGVILKAVAADRNSVRGGRLKAGYKPAASRLAAGMAPSLRRLKPPPDGEPAEGRQQLRGFGASG
jgi:hypothetical protein